MKRKSRLRQKFENNGLIMIAIMMVVIYWVFDYFSAGHILTRIMIVILVIIYGFFTQTLINSRKAALEEKDRVYQRLIQSEKLAALGAVAAGVAHEVKNPLAIIVQGIEFLKSSLYNDERLLDVTYRIEKSVIRADNIVKGLLSFSRDISLKMEELDIAPLIDESLSFVDDQLRLKNIHVKKRYESDLPKVIMDTHQMKQVFTNLFTNAIEAMPEGGILGIRTEPGKDKSEQSSVRVVISDTGVGIPEESIRKVFDPFFTTKNSDGNTGLGLSITKGIIDKHYGTIDIQSEPGRGTRVTVELPTGMV
jgi:two-component system, NtrC family, sensor kinase